MQVLYQLEWDAEKDAGAALEAYAQGLADRSISVNDPAFAFARSRVEGALAHAEAIDKVLGRCARRWRIDRMASVDRNILRLGAFELCYCPDIPPQVAINEAVELAKRFSGEDSGAFVNGILDAVLRQQERGRLTGT